MIATIPIGYADGFSRKLLNFGGVYVEGNSVSTVGKMCMNQFMFDVTSIPNVSMRDEVILRDAPYTANNMGRDIGTIGYEMIRNNPSRVRKIHV